MLKARYLIGIGILIGLVIGLICGAIFTFIGMAHVVNAFEVEVNNPTINAGINETAFVYALNQTGAIDYMIEEAKKENAIR